MPLPSTTRRVPEHTSPHANQMIRQRTEASLRYYADHPDQIGHRLKELDEEWDIERVLEANAAGFSLLGIILSKIVDSRWLLLTFGVVAFLLQHALQGWCPPLPVFRRMGYRTQAEIESERYALKALRGDFRRVSDADDANDKAMAATTAIAA